MFEMNSSLTEMTYKIASFPNYDNPYAGLFYDALKPYKIDHVGPIKFSLEWLSENKKNLDALHIHWPEKIWRVGSRLRNLNAVLGLRLFLQKAHKLGLKRIWTVHNLKPHDSYNWIDQIGHLILAQNSDLLICHSKWTIKQVRNKYSPMCPAILMYHGNYYQVYPKPRPREIVLQELDLRNDRPIVCCIGILRPYKGIEVACKAIRKLGGQVQLIIAGRQHPTMKSLPKIDDLASSISLIPYHLTNQEFSDIISVSEAVLLPYLKISGSGVLLASWTLGRGVIASDLPYFQEILFQKANAGKLFKTGDPDSLAKLIIEYIQVPFQIRSQAALEMSQRYSWKQCIKPVAKILTEWNKEIN